MSVSIWSVVPACSVEKGSVHEFVVQRSHPIPGHSHPHCVGARIVEPACGPGLARQPVLRRNQNQRMRRERSAEVGLPGLDHAQDRAPCSSNAVRIGLAGVRHTELRYRVTLWPDMIRATRYQSSQEKKANDFQEPRLQFALPDSLYSEEMHACILAARGDGSEWERVRPRRRKFLGVP